MNKSISFNNFSIEIMSCNIGKTNELIISMSKVLSKNKTIVILGLFNPTEYINRLKELNIEALTIPFYKPRKYTIVFNDIGIPIDCKYENLVQIGTLFYTKDYIDIN